MADLAVWQRTIVDEKGDIIPGAEIEVRSYPGGSLITLYRGPDGAQIKGNPFRTGEDGFARFWAESQRAEIIAHGAGSTIRWIVDLINADEVIGDAVSEATAAAADAVSEAKAEADRAEAARDAAINMAPGVYPDTATGRSATSVGDYFAVVGASGDEYLRLYRNTGGPSELIATAPAIDALTTLIGSAGVVTDWDAITRSGFYASATPPGETTGAPEGLGRLSMLHIETFNRAHQLAMSLNVLAPALWTRARHPEGYWGDWEKLANRSDIDEIESELEALETTQSLQESLLYQSARSLITAGGAAERQGVFSSALLDPLPQPYAAFGMMRLLSDYSGPIGKTHIGVTEAEVFADSDGRVSVASAAASGLEHGQSLVWNAWYDQSGNERHALPGANGSPEIPLTQGNAALSRRTNDTLMRISDSADFHNAAEGMTFGLILRPESAPPSGRLPVLAMQDESTGELRLQIARNNTGTLFALATVHGGTNGSLNSAAPLSDQWTALVVRVNWAAGTMDIWQDGEVTSATFSAGALPAINSLRNVSILNQENADLSTGFPFRGLVGGIVMFKEALSDAARDFLGEAMAAAAPNRWWGKRLARIAWMTDVHVSDRDPHQNRYYRDSLTKMADAVDTWQALDEQPDAVVVGGDLGESGDSDFLDNMAAIHSTLSDLDTQRIIYLLGNHDLGGPTRNSKDDVLAALGGYNDKAYGVTYLKGVRLIWLDSNYAADDDDSGYDQLPNSEWSHLDTWIPPSQRAWLEEELGRSMLPTVIFSHNPMDHDHHYSVNNYEEILRILRDSGANVLGVIAGHAHTNEARIVDGIPHYRTHALVYGALAEGNNAYATIDIYENRLVVHGYGNQSSYNTMPDY